MRADKDLADDGIAKGIKLRQQREGVLSPFLPGPTGNLGATNTDSGNGGAQRHGVGRCFCDLATDKCKDALHQCSTKSTILGVRVIDQFVYDHTTFFTERECGFIDKDDTNGSAFTCDQRVALEYVIPFGEGDLGAIYPDRLDDTIRLFNPANGFSGLRQLRKRSVLEQRKLPWGRRSGQLDRKLGRNDCSSFRHQIRWHFKIKEIADNNLHAVFTGQQQIRSLGREVSFQ